jgi:hypothetical protein
MSNFGVLMLAAWALLMIALGFVPVVAVVKLFASYIKTQMKEAKYQRQLKDAKLNNAQHS